MKRIIDRQRQILKSVKSYGSAQRKDRFWMSQAYGKKHFRRSAMVQDIWEGVRAQPGRTGLSLLAVATGIAALATVLAIVAGLENKSRQLQTDLGLNVVGVLGGQNIAEHGLCSKHVRLLQANFPDYAIASIRRHTIPVIGSSRPLTVLATDYTLADIRQWTITSGRFLDKTDIAERARHAVISSRVSELRGWQTGHTVNLCHVPLKIVGVVDIGGGALENEPEHEILALGTDVMFVPNTISPNWLSQWAKPSDSVDAIFMRVTGSDNLPRIVKEAETILSAPDCRASGISWVTPQLLIRRVTRIQRSIIIAGGSIAILCLVLGGTALMSLMIADVRERIAEIGLRRALGATRRDIAALFLIEASIVTGLGGVLGVVSSYVLLMFGPWENNFTLEFGIKNAVMPVIVATALGMLFAVWPAARAACITPAEALRND
ncbi:MAG: ABC transporter permease [Lentisphaerae bacterium]|nr:ABC transporter permease [Lentisphaerota bacterium]